MPSRVSSSAPPTPESLRICTEPIAPAARMISPRARAYLIAPFWRQCTAAARVPSNSIFSTRQLRSSRRLARLSTGLMKARAAGEPELAPMVVIGGLAAHVDHGVDGRGAADHLAARIVEAAAVEALLRLGPEHPVRARIADGEEIPDGDVEPDPIVLAAGFEQQHAHCRIGGQAVRQQAAGRARADDDVVVIAFERRGVGHGTIGYGHHF